ncbi:MAG: peptide chain release factor 2 [Chthoniobacterales bacterium]
MSEELSSINTSELSDRVGELGGIFDYPDLVKQLEEIEARMTAPDFWDNKELAQSEMERVSSLRAKITPFKDIETRVADLEVMHELAAEEEDLTVRAATVAEMRADCDRLTADLSKFELQQFLSGEFDSNPAFVTIHAGAGGTESCDWADMLLRMYQRWMERSGISSEVVDVQEGDEAGIKSVTLRMTGDYAYGYLSCERGVHRLVRISPFDSNKRRHTSFASVDVTPEIEDAPVVVDEKDLKIDTFRSGGKGGQNVNKVETAVRFTHLPTGLVVACQAERSQLKNRNLALKILKAKLYQLEADKKRAEAEREYDQKGEIGWGSQIRSYVFQPYQMVKDLRTGVQTSDIQGVMDGDIDAFIEGKLRGLTYKKGASDDDDL